MITRLRYPKGYQFFDGNGSPLALGNLYYYAAGTTTPQDTYSNSGGSVVNTNPITLDGSGRLQVDVFLGSASDYKEVLTASSATVSPWPDDNILRAGQADWNATSGPSQIFNKPALAAVATSGSYTDLSNTPPNSAPFTGDSGSGGTVGLVPAPAAGTAVANKFLKADGTWSLPPGGSGSATNLTVTETANSVAIASSTGSGATIPAATSSAAGALDGARAAKIDGLAAVATSGSYNDLSSKPTIPSAQVNTDWNATSGIAQILNKPVLAASATSDTTNASNISSGTLPPARLPAASVTALGGVNSKAAAAHQFLTAINIDGTISSAQPAASDVSGLATVAASGSYTDLSNKPSIPAAQVNSDWTAATGLAQILNKPVLAASATTDATNASNISTGTLAAGRLPAPTATSLGGVKALASTSHLFLTSIGTDGGPVASQPAASDITGLAASATTDTTNASNITSGTLPAAQLPLFSSSAKGAVAASGGGTTSFLRADGTWAAVPSTPPAGSSGQLQYDNAGAFGGAAGLIWNATSGQLTITSSDTTGVAVLGADSPLSVTGAVNSPALSVSGYSSSGSDAGQLVNLAGTWNTTGAPTGLKLNITNTASSASALLADFQIGSTSKFSVRQDGFLRLGSGTPQYELRGRGTDVVSYGVPYFRSVGTNLPTALDIMPNGTASTYFSAWLDVCNSDLSPANSTVFQCCIVATNGSTNTIGTHLGGGASALPLNVCGSTIGFYDQAVPTAQYGQIGATGLNLGSSSSGYWRWIYSSGDRVPAGWTMLFYSSANIFGTTDLGITRASAGLLQITGGTSGLGSIQATDLFSTNASFMHRSKATLSNGAAAQTATLTNGPTSGNPTKWIPIDDNGVTRYIPAW